MGRVASPWPSARIYLRLTSGGSLSIVPIMESAEVEVSRRVVADVSPHLFGALTEHFGTGIYGGLWDVHAGVPRADVQAAVAAMGASMLRYPGGCFADWYHWRDGVGPHETRPTYDETFWTGYPFHEMVPEEMAPVYWVPDEVRARYGPVETNAFGTNEYLQYCLDVGAEPLLVANFGGGSAEEAAAWVHYTNRSGHAPRDVRWWSVGNELYGEWEIGHCSPEEYAEGFSEFARAMRSVDPDIRLVAVGTAGRSGQYRDTWNSTIVREIGRELDALSVHWYFNTTWMGRPLRDDEGDYLQVAAGSDGLGAVLDGVIEDIDANSDGDHRIPLSLDEWNLLPTFEALLQTNHRQSDAVFFAGCFNRMLERADRVRSAAISHLVNCMGPIQTRGDRCFVTSAHLVSMLYRRESRRDSVQVDIDCESFDVPPFRDTSIAPGEAVGVLANIEVAGQRSTALDAAATVDESGATVFLANRRLDRPIAVTVKGLPPHSSGRLRLLDGEPFAVNHVNKPNALQFRDVPVTVGTNGSVTAEVPPHSVGALALA